MGLRSGIYVRISDDREGSGLGIQRQEEDCRRLAQRLGWDVGEIYADNDISAFSGKERPRYEQMLRDIESGRVDALITWHTDRLHRNVRELLDFLDIVSVRDRRRPETPFGIQTVQAGQLDLTSPTGRAMAITFGAWAEQNSAHKGERIRRKIQQLVEDGQVHNGGPRPFGYTRIYAGEGPRRKILRDEINPEEAEIVRQCKDRALAGDSLRSIVGDLNERGIQTSMGNAWTIQAMRWVLRSGRIAGLKEFHREVVGEAAWPAIITVDEHRQLRALFSTKQPLSGVRVRKYFLTGLVYCSCTPAKFKAMRIVATHGKPKYSCAAKKEGGCGGRVIALAELEYMAGQWIVGRLNDPETLRMLAEREAVSKSDTGDILRAIEKDETRLRVLESQLADDDDEDLVEVVGAVRKVRQRIRDNRDQLARLAGATPLVGLDLPDLASRWPDLPLDRKRALAKLLISRVVIYPTTIRGRFDPERVDILPH
ncbi:recombinase family protein [Nonomuraea sp. NPDC050663]|uniref:recombinase family protein n=1 Tax=Nonomuraea sp. NPDC050663 TaxID=3364370 RepID=UPI0037ACABBA